MHRLGLKFEVWSSRRVVAVLGCLALLYFGGGGALLHQHTGAPDTACSVCHSVHVPVLAAAALQLLSQEQQLASHHCVLPDATPLDSFALYRASRAPPAL